MLVDFLDIKPFAIALHFFAEETGGVTCGHSGDVDIGEVLDAPGAVSEGGPDLPAEVALAAFAVAHVGEGDDDLVEGRLGFQTFSADGLEIIEVIAGLIVLVHLPVGVPAEEGGLDDFEVIGDEAFVAFWGIGVVGEEIVVGEMAGIFFEEILGDGAESRVGIGAHFVAEDHPHEGGMFGVSGENGVEILVDFGKVGGLKFFPMSAFDDPAVVDEGLDAGFLAEVEKLEVKLFLLRIIGFPEVR